MPKLSRSDWYDLSRDTNWNLRYVTEEDAFPEQLSGTARPGASPTARGRAGLQRPLDDPAPLLEGTMTSSVT
jgi:hypothetical protein